MKIALAGIGYVGLSLAVLLSQQNEVFAIDVIKEKVDQINNKISPIQDKEIEEYLKTKDLNLMATTFPNVAYKDADFIIIATPTNYDSEKNFFDTSHVEEVIELASTINNHATYVIKSTIPVGYTEQLKKQFPSLKIIFSPEFLRESKALYDNLYPSRIIIGSSKTDATLREQGRVFANLLKNACLKPDVPVLEMDATEAEAVKLFANTYLALRIAYFNELDTYAESKGLNAKDIIDGVCLDSRIGAHYNNPSFGYGGYCLPKDTKQLKANFRNVPENLISAIVEANKTRKDFITSEIIKKCKSLKKDNKDVAIGIYRLTMKKDSNNFRDSSILDIIKKLIKAGYKLNIYEPNLNSLTIKDATLINNFDEFIKTSDIIVANRMNDLLKPYQSKVFTRDIFNEN